jgi:hypothetical protein
MIQIKNGRNEKIDHVKIMDVLPNTFKSTEEFGTLKPTRIQQGTKGKRFIWELEHLTAQEERILSYKIKSNYKLIGETRLPPTLVQFTTKKGKIISEKSATISIQHTPVRHQ